MCHWHSLMKRKYKFNMDGSVRGKSDFTDYDGVPRDTGYVIGIFFDPLEIHDSD